MRQELNEAIRIDLTLWRDLQNDLSARTFDAHDPEPPRCDLQPNDFEKILSLAGQSSETVEQFVSNQSDLVLVSCTR